MAGNLFLGVGTIGMSKRKAGKPCSLLQAVRHNLRFLQKKYGAVPSIDPTRTHLNEILEGPESPEEVVALSHSLMEAEGVAKAVLREDYTQAVELIFSLKANHQLDENAYFLACVIWAKNRFGSAKVLSAVVHKDEQHPHLHVLISPLVDGRVNGSALVTKAKFAALNASFFNEVARIFGLQKPPARLAGAKRSQLANRVLAWLQSNHDPVLRSMAWPCIRETIERDPVPFAESLGFEIESAPTKPKTMAEIFTGRGKGPKVERTDTAWGYSKPKGFELTSETGPENHANLSCVGFGSKLVLPTHPIAAPQPERNHSAVIVN